MGTQTTIMGKRKHFYTFTTANAFELTTVISEGPAIHMALHEGCVSYYRNSDYFFYRERYCSFEEDCSLYVSSEAATPSGDTYYVVITSGQNYVNNQDADNTFLFHSDTDYLSVNGYSLKPTSYSLTLNVAPSTSSTGFCSGRTAGNTWAFNNMDLKSSDAQYNCYSPRYRVGSSNCLATPTPAPIVDDDDEYWAPPDDDYDHQVIVNPFPDVNIDNPDVIVNIEIDDDGQIASNSRNSITDNDNDSASTFSFSLIFVLSSFIFAFLFSLLF